MPRFLVNIRIAAALVLAVIVCGVAARADVVIMKDGYTIHGVKTAKEKAVVIDEVAGTAFLMPDPRGMTAVDDGPRWVVFPVSTNQIADVSDANRFKDFVTFTRDRDKGDQKLPSTARNAEVVKEWDVKEWTRVLKFNDDDLRLKHTVQQQITVITPHYLRIGSRTHTIARYFLTKEFKPEFIRSLLVNHPDLIEMTGKPIAERRDRMIRFWIQADWLDEADRDLDRLIADLPAEKERFARLKSEVNALRSDTKMTEIERAHASGRHQWAMQALAGFPKDDVPKAVSVKVTALRAEYEARTARFAAARRYLDTLPKQVNAAANQFLAEGAAAVREEMHLDTLSRLDMFVTLAERAEKDSLAGRRPSHPPEELIAAAITGWNLGKVAAEPKVSTAYKCWMTRQMALEYLRTPQPVARQRILNNYLVTANALPYDELEKLVSLMPPPDATPATIPASREPMRVNLPATVANPAGLSFLVRLPEEYQPGRSYPVLILLADPTINRTPDELLKEFGELPVQHGYIVAAPQWWDPFKNTYMYTKEEQGTVLQLLRHLRRTYQVDSDRVFLCGNSEGASLALDMGASHPDLFAGIVPVNPAVVQRLYIPCEYWVNLHQLPMYMIMGDKFGPSIGSIRMLSERIMPRGFPSLVVSYKGRGQEWFAEELPYVFDWMDRKRRADPGKVLGPQRFEGKTQVEGFSSVRRNDNRFHWLSTEDIKPERTVGNIMTSGSVTPAKFSARIADGNTVSVKVTGMRDVTVWFGKGMLDYSKPVTVKLTGAQKPVTKQITPKIEVLMEDLFERGDRQRPYFERIDLKVPQ